MILSKKRTNLKSVFRIVGNLIGYADNTGLRSNVIRNELLREQDL